MSGLMSTVVGATIWLISGTVMYAQAVKSVTTADAGNIQVSARVAKGLVTLDLQNVTVEAALQIIADQAGLKLLARKDILPAKKLITAHFKAVAAADALRYVLSGTGLNASISPTGRLLIEQTKSVRSLAQGIIAGKVTDVKSGKAIIGANVSINADNRGVVTDENGSYRITGVAAGVHTVVVRLVGYAKQTRSITVGEGVTIALDFRLEASASVLNEVVVTGTVVSTELKAVPSAITVVTAKDIEQRGITHIDQLFRGEIPGLFSIEQGTNANLDQVVMFSRGTTKISTFADINTNPIKTYIDGVELADAQYLSQIDPKSIERIEILTGPQASTIYGANAINGVMQIFTKRGNTVRPIITLSLAKGFAQNNFGSALASSSQYDGSISGVAGKISYNAGSGWDHTGSWSPGKQIQRTSIYEGSRYQSTDFSLDLSARQGWTRNKQNGSSEQVLTNLFEDGGFSTTSTTGIITPTRALLYGRTLSTTLSYNPFSWWSHQFTLGNDASDTESLKLTAGFRNSSDSALGSHDKIPNSRISQSYSSTFRVPILSLAQATLTYGADHWRTRTSTTGWFINGDGSLSTISLTIPKPSKNSGAYVQGQLGLWDALFLTYGVRADWNPNYGERAKVRPGRYGISYSKDLGIVSAKLRGSYGRSIRPPEATQIQGTVILPTSASNSAQLAVYALPGSILYSRLPNPDLGPEFQQGGEGGIELYIGNRGSFIVTRYNQTVDGLIRLISRVDSLRALEPGIYTGDGANILTCNTVSFLRSDGYCYLPQQQNLNATSIRNQGWELQGTVNTGPLTTRGTYSWGKSRVIGVTSRYRSLLTGADFTPGQTFNLVPEHTWAMNVSYALKGTFVSLNVNGLGQSLHAASSSGYLNLVTSGDMRLKTEEAYRMNIPTGYREAYAGYITANMNVSQSFTSNVEATLQITNLTDHYQNDFNYKYPTLGRQSRFGLRWRWQ